MKTFNGGLFTDFEVAAAREQPALVAGAQGRQARLPDQRLLRRVRIGNGGPLITLDTLNGDVRVLRRARQE